MPQPQVLVSRGRGQEGAEGVGGRRAGERAGQEGGEIWWKSWKRIRGHGRGVFKGHLITDNPLLISKTLKR